MSSEREDEPCDYRVMTVCVPFSFDQEQVWETEREREGKGKEEAEDKDKDTSSGTLVIYRHNMEEQDQVSSCFFDEDYTIATETGFTFWPGTTFLMDYITKEMRLDKGFDEHHAPATIDVAGKKIVELGSGIGMLGLYLASIGAHVLMSDVPSVAQDVLKLNIEKNGHVPEKLRYSCSNNNSNSGDKNQANSNIVLELPWRTSMWVGSRGGSAGYMALDWTVDLDKQNEDGNFNPWDVDMLVAAETVWLKELVQPYVQTVVSLMKRKREASNGSSDLECVMCYTNRGTEESSTFAMTQELLDCFAEHDCTTTALFSGESIQSDGESKECTIYSITLLQ
eukprot:m.34410 g.34410  ORF g.34410 m.34410 type:complete len:338 (+) comp6530_c0_seq1:84-1097(+)